MRFSELQRLQPNIDCMIIFDALSRHTVDSTQKWQGVTFRTQILLHLLSERLLVKSHVEDYMEDAYTHLSTWFNSAALQPFMMKDTPVYTRKTALTRNPAESEHISVDLLTNFVAFIDSENKDLMYMEAKNNALLYWLNYTYSVCEAMLCSLTISMQKDPWMKLSFEELLEDLPEVLRNNFERDTNIHARDYCYSMMNDMFSLVEDLRKKASTSVSAYYSIIEEQARIIDSTTFVLAGFFSGFTIDTEALLDEFKELSFEEKVEIRFYQNQFHKLIEMGRTVEDEGIITV